MTLFSRKTAKQTCESRLGSSVWKQNKNNPKNKNTLDSLAAVIYKNQLNAPENSEKVVRSRSRS